jgi:hypothetical protein
LLVYSLKNIFVTSISSYGSIVVSVTCTGMLYSAIPALSP